MSTLWPPSTHGVLETTRDYRRRERGHRRTDRWEPNLGQPRWSQQGRQRLRCAHGLRWRAPERPPTVLRDRPFLEVHLSRLEAPTVLRVRDALLHGCRRGQAIWHVRRLRWPAGDLLPAPRWPELLVQFVPGSSSAWATMVHSCLVPSGSADVDVICRIIGLTGLLARDLAMEEVQMLLSAGNHFHGAWRL